MEKSNKRSSILKRPVAEDSSPTFTRSRRRISFSEKKNVKVFAPGNGGATIWIKSYEESYKESAEVAPANSTKGSLYSGPLATPELVMRLRNNKVISKVPKKICSKTKKSNGVENVPPADTSNEGEEQPSRKFCESVDISLSVSEMQQLLKVEERLPLRPITQHSNQIEEAESYVSSQASLTFQSPEKIYCSFAVTNNDIKALSKFNNGKKLDLTLADIMRDYDKKTLQPNNHEVSCLTPMDMVNEGNVSSAHAMGNIPKSKRGTMFNLENMELVTIQKSPSKRSTIYYYDNLELSLKDSEKQRISFSRLKPLATAYEIQEENFVKDYDKENIEVGVDNTDLELYFASIVDSQKNVDMKTQPMHDASNARKEDDINKENRGYIENEDFMDLSECNGAVQTVNRLHKQFLVHDFTAQKENDLDKMDISLSPGALVHSIQVKPSKNQQTIHQSCSFNLTNNENTLIKYIKTDKKILKEDHENENIRITETHGIENLFDGSRECALRRQTINIPCNMDLTLQDDKLQTVVGENVEPKNRDFKNDQCMDLSIETSQLLLEENKVCRQEKIDSRIKRRTLHNHIDLDFTLEEKAGESSEPNIRDFKNGQFQILPTETSQILMEESKVSTQEQIDSRKKRETLYNHLDLDLTLGEDLQGRCIKQADSKGKEIEINTNFTKEIQQKTSQNEEVRRQEATSKNYYVKSADLHIGGRNVGKINAIDCGIPQKTIQYEEENCRMKRRSVYTPLDMDLEEEADRIYIKQADLKKDAKNCLKLKEEKISKSSNSEEKIIFTQQRRHDVEFMKWSPISTSESSYDEYLPKKNLILSAKRQTIYDQCDLDISIQDETAKIAKSDDMVPVDLRTMKKTDDYDNKNFSLQNNAENNTISSIKRQMSFSSVNIDLTIQNDLKDCKNVEENNKPIVDTINNITSVESHIEHHIEPFNRTEKPSCLPIKKEKTSEWDQYSTEEPMTLTLHKLQSSQNKALNIFNKSSGKNSSNSTMEEGAKGTELEKNTRTLKSPECNMEINSLRNIDLSGCEQLDQTSEVIFFDLSSSNDTIDLGIEQLRNVEIVTETSPEIPRLSRASSSHTNTTISTFSANTTQALCNFDLSKITKKGYKPNLKTTSDYKFKDTSFDNSYDYIPPVTTADEIQEINLSISNLNLNCTSKDVNLKNDNCDNILKNQQIVESKRTIDRRKSSCDRCKVCDCKPNTGENKSDVSIFTWEFEAPSQPCKVDFSGYEKFHNMPSIRDILDAHKRRRESLNFESYEESVFCPTVPSLDFLLENYEKQYKLQVEKEIPVGAIFPLIPSLEILLSNKLQSEHFGWKLNTLCMPVGIMEFRHNTIPSITLILGYSAFGDSKEEKLIFEKVQLKISKLYGNSSPLDRIIENEICAKAPYDLINYCSCFNDLFSFLSFMNNICEKSVQLGKELFRRVVGFNGSLQKDNSDVCFIKKRVLYTPRCNQKGLMSTHDFLVRVKNIESISHTDIMLPPLSDFKESICSIPKGLEFLTTFFFDPISYLKTEY